MIDNLMPLPLEKKIVDEEEKRSDKYTESVHTELSESQAHRRRRCDQSSKKLVSKNSLRNHKKYYHIYIATISATQYMGGSCVDPDRTIYMFRYSFKENGNPVHVMPYFGSSECRELSNMAKRSKNPNFICCHLKISVQRVIESAISLCIRYLENRCRKVLNKKVYLIER